MSLRLIPSKSWNVYSAKNRARVRRDEAADARAKAARASKESLALFETLQARGRERAGLERGTDWTVLSADSAVETGGVGRVLRGEKAGECISGQSIGNGRFQPLWVQEASQSRAREQWVHEARATAQGSLRSYAQGVRSKGSGQSLLQQHSRQKARTIQKRLRHRAAQFLWSFGGTGASAERNSDCEGVGREEKNEKRGRQRSQKATERRKNKLRKRKEKKKREKKRKKKERAQQKRVRKGKG